MHLISVNLFKIYNLYLFLRNKYGLDTSNPKYINLIHIIDYLFQFSLTFGFIKIDLT